jgi:hypothetical protein
MDTRERDATLCGELYAAIKICAYHVRYGMIYFNENRYALISDNPQSASSKEHLCLDSVAQVPKN